MPTTVEAQEKLPETRGRESAIDGTVNNGHPAKTAAGAAVAEPMKPKAKKEKKDGSGSKRNKKAKKDVPKPLTKVIIRRLPPSMDEETFRKQIDPIPDHDDFYFVSGDWSLGKNACSRAYINFTRSEDIYLFKDKFDGYIFVDAKGVEFPAVVEFAPFQELPRNRSRKKDVKCDTIETDTHFIAFKEALEAEEKDTAGKSKSKLEFTYKIKDEEKITSTPLLEYIAQKKQEKREEKRKKMEEKKKQRKEDRHKKSQPGKAIPEVIKEEKEKVKEEEVVVRTVPSRLDPNQGKKDMRKKGNEKMEDGKDVKDKEKKPRNRKEKEKEKEKERGKQDKDEVGGEQEKVLSRKQERDRQRREKDKARKQEEKDKKASGEPPRKDKEVAPKPESQVQKAIPVEAPKKEVKKYSERRKETRARAETRLAELEDKDRKDALNPVIGEEFQAINVPKVDIKKSMLTPHVAPFIPKEKSTIILGESSFALPPAFPLKSASTTPTQQDDVSLASAKKEPTPVLDVPAADSSSSDRKADIDEKLKEMREARKIRNKDRPSIKIYQPRKRLASGTAAGSKDSARSEDDKVKEKSDSDRSSDKSVKPGSHGAKDREKRHKLTKKASDRERPKDRRSRRKNSSDADGGREKEADSRKTSREEPAPPAEPISPTVDKPKEKFQVTEVVEALEGVKLES
ncbi:regulator of nonsense transcripts 3B-like [Ochlerotatus camptorhynchus]|uniref:regulator of nonsense transcripts 3B-like n=1 Tax=Ochlerotatus camptorhynchus TaxID=644619 RepID=UPI0031DCC57A